MRAIIGTKWSGVHFGMTIAKSYESLEKAALSRRPGLRHRDHRTIRDYMTHLRKSFPSLSPQLCDEYTATYERAVFSDAKFTLEGITVTLTM
jgi:hypothetical protein